VEALTEKRYRRPSLEKKVDQEIRTTSRPSLEKKVDQEKMVPIPPATQCSEAEAPSWSTFFLKEGCGNPAPGVKNF